MFLRLLKESFVFAWQALVVNKLRTTLSLLGVTIGIFSIIFVLSVVDSMEADMKSSLDMIGSDILFVQKWPMGPEEGDKEFEWWKYMSRRQPSLKDMEKLDKRLDVHSAIAFQTSTEKAAEYKNNFLDPVFVTAVSYEYLETITLKIQTGRYFTKQECDAGKNVAIIGSLVAEQLFGSEEALGKDIKVGGLKCSVIGILKKEGASLFGNGTDQAVFLPVEFGLRLMDLDSQDGSIIVKAKEGVSNQELKDQVIATFREIRSIKPGRDRDFSIIESKMISGMVDSIVGVFNIAGMIIGIFAILVGAFSIANIMFVSVRERTNIIGIQKSLGAKNYFILFQFLFESIALCLIGGAFGLLLVFLLAQILTAAFEFEFILPLSRIVMGISISVIVGVISGFVPAWRASRLNPVDAIRSK
ncbi:MAG: ABC transporter permease [Pseudomonadota bacterium]|jgi:putative ABC transport system permease protein